MNHHNPFLETKNQVLQLLQKANIPLSVDEIVEYMEDEGIPVIKRNVQSIIFSLIEEGRVLLDGQYNVCLLSNPGDIWKKIVKEITFQFERSSGPGGQHVNVTSSKVRIKFDVKASKALTEEQKTKIATDVIVTQCSEHRSQHRNRTQALKMLRERIENALVERPRRIETNIPERSKKARLTQKKVDSMRKKDRQQNRNPEADYGC